MGHRLETSRRISGKQLIPDELQVNKSSKFHDKYEFPTSHEVRKFAVKEQMVNLKTSKNYQKGQLGSVSNRGDELVKHMSNLPKYLQRAENEKSVQGKALNFGVLDWKRLENWKLNESMPPRSHQKSPKVSVMSSQEKKILDSMKSTQGKSIQAQDFGKDKMKTDNEVNLAPQNGAPKPQNVVIRSPKAKHCRRSYSGISQISESRILPNGDSVEPEKNRYSDSYFSQESFHRELYPISHSCSLPVNESSSSKSGRKQYAQNRNSDLFPCNHQDDMLTLPTLRKKKPSMTSLDSFETSQKMDPSPNRRFSFSLGRLSRSFSSVLPELSATKPIPNSGLVDSHIKSSPLRRLLDPLVKSKKLHSAKTSKPPTFEALLHLMYKDGLPFFKFVANNGNDILAAAINKLPGKGDGCLIYSFCKVSVIKKKSGGWVGQGSKGKFGYNIIGMMKVSNSNSDECFVKESILYSVDFGPGDEQNRELAAIMVRNQTMKHNEEEELSKQKMFVVILPGGVHGLPHKGAPSSLTERWRSGGSCDCGGWDVGCKLRILAGDEKYHENLDSISLFDQEKKAMFWLSPLKNGIYSVKHDASITLLETFSACVAILTSQKLSHILEDSSSSKSYKFFKTSTTIPSPPLSPVARI